MCLGLKEVTRTTVKTDSHLLLLHLYAGERLRDGAVDGIFPSFFVTESFQGSWGSLAALSNQGNQVFQA